MKSARALPGLVAVAVLPQLLVASQATAQTAQTQTGGYAVNRFDPAEKGSDEGVARFPLIGVERDGGGEKEDCEENCRPET